MSGWAASCMRKSCNFHALGNDHKITGFSLTFTSKSRVCHALISLFCWHHQILIEEWNQSLMLPPKKWSWMHGLIWWWIIFSRWSIVIILSLSHVSHLMMHREWRHDQSTSFASTSTLWKGLGNQHFAKVPVKRELSSGVGGSKHVSGDFGPILIATICYVFSAAICSPYYAMTASGLSAHIESTPPISAY